MDHPFLLILYVIALLPISSGHTLIAKVMWPLTEVTGGNEVLKKVTDLKANLSSTAVFGQTEPTLNYNALDLTANTFATIQLGQELNRKKFSLMGMFHVNPHEHLVFFQYFSQESGLEFKVYVSRCYLYIQSRRDDRRWGIKGAICDRGLQWYTLSAVWKDKNLEVVMIWADPNSNKGDAVLEAKEKDLFEHYSDCLPGNGQLMIGRNATGMAAVCCVRIYYEAVDRGHVETQMWDNCKPKPFWTTMEPIPCASEPCENSATCVNLDAGDYTCLCRPWESGKHCEQELWTTNRGFRFAGHVDVTQMLPYIDNFVNVTVRSKEECASLCLQQNICLSFALSHDSKCTLFDDVPTSSYPLSSVSTLYSMT